MFRKTISSLLMLSFVLTLFAGVGVAADSLYWDFNSQTIPPNTEIDTNPTFSYSTPGPLGGTDNYFFRFNLPGTGGVMPLSRGYRWRLQNDATYINNQKIAFQATFMVMNTFVYASLLDPRFGSTNSSFSSQGVYIKDGVIYYENDVIATVPANQWFTLGAALTMSSTNGTSIDIYFNGEKVVEGAYNAARTEGLAHFRTILGSTCTAEAQAAIPRFNNRGEYLCIDDLYITTDLSIVAGELELESSYPVNGAVDVAYNANVTLDFSKPVDITAFNDSYISITPPVNRVITWSNNNKTATLKFPYNLQQTTEYTVGISNLIIDTDGIAYSDISSIQFATAVGIPGFSVLSSYPAATQTDVPITTSQISILFNNPAEISYFDEQTITITPLVQTSGLAWDASHTTATLNLSEELKEYTTYTVTIDETKAYSAAGAYLTGSNSFVFTTGRGRLNYSQNFEEFTTGKLTNPLDYGFVTASGSLAITNVSDGQGNVIQYGATAGNRYLYMHPREITDAQGTWSNVTQNNKAIAIRFKMKLSNSNITNYDLIRTNHTDTYGAGFDLLDGTYRVSGSQVSIGDFVPDQWEEFGIVMNLSSTGGAVSDLYFNGAKVAEGIVSATAIGDFNRIRMKLSVVESNTITIDDVLMTEDINIFEPDIEIESSAPADGDTNAEIQNVVINFNAPVKDTSLAGSFTVTTGTGDPVAITDAILSNSGMTLTLFLEGGMQYDTSYTVMIDEDMLVSTYDRPFTGLNTIQFTTMDEPVFLFETMFYSGTGELKTPTQEMVTGDITIESSLTGIPGRNINGVLIVSHYRDGQLLSTKNIPFALDDQNLTDSIPEVIENCLATDTVKVFTWSDLYDIIPLAQPGYLPPVAN